MVKKILVNVFRYFNDFITSENGLIKRKLGRHVMYLDPNDGGISSQLKRSIKGEPDREPAFMKILRQELKPDMIALDLGANLGYVTLIMAEIVGKNGKVYAIEPSPHNYEILKKNIQTNDYSDTVEAYQIAISNKDGNSTFYMSDKTNLGSMDSTIHTKNHINVQAQKFDSFFTDKEPPNFIKMDIEGHEVEALEGMYETAKKANLPFKILMEVHPMYYSEEHNLEKQLRRFIDIGFSIKYLVSAGVAIPDFFKQHGYAPKEIFKASKWERAIYENVENEHALIAACREHQQYIETKRRYSKKIVRAIMIEKERR